MLLWLMNVDQQEEIAKSEFRPRAAWISGLLAGGFFLVMSKGFPWISSGLPDAIMGRPMNFQQGGLVLASVLQMALSLIYAFAVGAIVFRFRPLAAVFSGGAVGGLLYGA